MAYFIASSMIYYHSWIYFYNKQMISTIVVDVFQVSQCPILMASTDYDPVTCKMSN
jgi:hypothetical protein